MSAGRAVIWHEVECGGYAADLPAWRELAAGAAGPVLELGCGAGRVALDLARSGAEVCGVDIRGELLAELRARAARERLEVATERADVRRLDLGRRFALVIAPMQLAHLLGGAPGRAAMLAGVRAHLRPGGRFGAALLAPGALAAGNGDGAGPPLPDVREVEGWVYSSLPVETRRGDAAIEVRRLRQAVSPEGELSEELDVTTLERLTVGELEREAAAAGLRPAGRLEVAPTADHVGSEIAILEAS